MNKKEMRQYYNGMFNSLFFATSRLKKIEKTSKRFFSRKQVNAEITNLIWLFNRTLEEIREEKEKIL